MILGNSLSYSNDLPGMLNLIGLHNGVEIEVDCICKPNYAIIDHWNDGDMEEVLSRRKYKYVILQQGPSSQSFGREVLLEYGKKYHDLAAQYQTETAFFMVWPSVQYYQTFDGVIKNYADAATNTHSILIPAGIIWKNFRASSHEEVLYGKDGFHPSTTGSMLAALVIMHSLFPDVKLKEYDNAYQKWILQSDYDMILRMIRSYKK